MQDLKQMYLNTTEKTYVMGSFQLYLEGPWATVQLLDSVQNLRYMPNVTAVFSSPKQSIIFSIGLYCSWTNMTSLSPPVIKI